ncbi:MAG TPA: class I SAM-dependent methyltransferase [Gammaproteobacteria bacterium]|nr:class I SAM-dependent methyltransferase [Gammaproteobacteria bacterium]
MSAHTLPLTETLYRYLLDHSLREPPVLARLREETQLMAQASMQISPEQGQFLAMLVRLIGARRCLEVGSFTGYSSTAVALALPPDGRLLCLDVSEVWTARARRAWQQAGVENKVELRLAPARESLEALIAGGAGETFDFAFIDADKTNYLHYYEAALALLRPGGLIAVDNVLWGGSVADPADQSEDTIAIRAFNDALHADRRVDLSLLSIGDGLTLARKREA